MKGREKRRKIWKDAKETTKEHQNIRTADLS